MVISFSLLLSFSLAQKPPPQIIEKNEFQFNIDPLMPALSNL